MCKIRKINGRKNVALLSRKWPATFQIPTYKFITRLNHDLFAGTPYEQDALGTKASLDQTTGEMLRTFTRNGMRRITPFL